jgi:hypothetical protein
MRLEMRKSCPLVFLTILSVLILSNCNFPPSNNNSYIYAYPNISNIFTVINAKTNQVDKEVTMDLPKGVLLFGWCMSSDDEHLIFAGFDTSYTEYPICIIDYGICNDTIESIYNTGIQCLAVPRIGTAILDGCDSKVYLSTYANGLYIIDFKSQKTQLLSSEINVEKSFYTFNDLPMTIIKKYITTAFMGASYTELEFYYNDSTLSQPEFVLNQDDVDSIDVTDIGYSQEKNKIFITYLISNGRSRDISVQFGSYDLETLELTKSNFTLPWSSNSYSITNSDLRNECYVVGQNDTVYVIDVTNDTYSIKDKIYLENKTIGPTKSILVTDDNFAYFGCSRDNRIYVCDLNNREIINQLFVERPYLFLSK